MVQYREEFLRFIGVFKEAVLAILASIAKQERVQAGLSRARAQSKVLGRPRAAVRPERGRRPRQGGLSMRQIAAETGVSPMTVQRLLAANAG
jgi:DNA invertase Pin-like site-specific DNA recombinase